MTNTTKTLAKMLITLGLLVGSANAMQVWLSGTHKTNGKEVETIATSYDSYGEKDYKIEFTEENAIRLCEDYYYLSLYFASLESVEAFWNLRKRKTNFQRAFYEKLEELARKIPDNERIVIDLSYTEYTPNGERVHTQVFYYNYLEKYSKGKVFDEMDVRVFLGRVMQNIYSSNYNPAELKKLPKPQWN